MTTAECSTDALRNDTMTGQKARSVQLYFDLIMLCTRRVLDRIANVPHGWVMEAWRVLFQAYSPQKNARLVVTTLEVLAFLLDTDDVNSLETMERKIKELEKCASSEIPEFLKIGIVIRQAEERPMTTQSHHELAQVGNIPGHQNGSDTQTRECSERENGRRNGRGSFRDRIQKCLQKLLGKKLDSEEVCWYCEKKGHRAQEAKGQRQWNVERFQERRQQREEQQGKVQRQRLQMWQDRSHVKGLQIQRNECIRCWRRVGWDRLHRNGRRRFERIGDWSSVVAGKGTQNSYRNRFVCCSECVSH